jgi:hypothetical protein
MLFIENPAGLEVLKNAHTREWLLGILTANSAAVIMLVAKVYKSINLTKNKIHKYSWRVNILWADRLKGLGITEDPIEKEIFTNEFMG